MHTVFGKITLNIYDCKKNVLVFETSIPVFSWFIAKVMGLVLLIPLGIIGAVALSSIIQGGKFSDLTPDIYFASGFVGLLFFLTYAVMAFMFPKGFVSKVRMDEKGISQVSMSQTGNVNRAVIIGGIITGKPGAVGTGLLAETGDDRSANWKDMKIVKINPDTKYMYFSRGALTLFPIGFYCPGKRYKEVIRFITKYFPLHSP